MPVKPPRPVSPPLTALRAFEAAARLGGFTRAADELCVTPGAVAQQIKHLESWCGAALFERRAQGVFLTEAGRQTLPALTSAFDQLGDAVRELRQATSPNRIHLAALPAIAQLWLTPRLPAIRAAMPELVLSVTAMETPPNLTREPYDLALFFTDDVGHEIAPDVIFPVCTPELARQLSAPHDLAALPCISDAAWSADWQLWLESVGASRITPHGPVHSLYALAVEDALNGAGVVMAHEALVSRHLQSGALVRPFGQKLTLPRKLRLLSRPDGQSRVLRNLIDLLSGESGL